MTDNNKQLIDSTISFVKKEFIGAEGGHDWWHTYRVWKMATAIAIEENANILIVELAALLHDIADSKFYGGDEEIGPVRAKEFLSNQLVNQETINQVVNIIKYMSFKKTFDSIDFSSLELDIVRDADRLDAIGAIGIARTFNYGGFTDSEIYNPDISPRLKMTKEEYKSSKSPTINHFYEKLLLLKDLMVTNTGKKIADSRHRFMENYLQQFYLEWDGKA